MTEVQTISVTLPITLLTLSVIVSATLQVMDITSELLDSTNYRIIKAAYPDNPYLSLVGMKNLTGPILYRYLIVNDRTNIKIKVYNTSGRLVDFNITGSNPQKLEQLLTTYAHASFSSDFRTSGNNWTLTFTQKR